jgi:ribosomal protein S27AE
MDRATVTTVSPEQPSCPTCGAPTIVVDHHEPPLRTPVPRTVCTSLICPTNLEGFDDVEPLAGDTRAAG